MILKEYANTPPIVNPPHCLDVHKLLHEFTN